MKSLKEKNPDNFELQQFELKELNDLALAAYKKVQFHFKRDFH